MLPAYAELHALSHFSFQRGASSPDEMVARALGYRNVQSLRAAFTAGGR